MKAKEKTMNPLDRSKRQMRFNPSRLIQIVWLWQMKKIFVVTDQRTFRSFSLDLSRWDWTEVKTVDWRRSSQPLEYTDYKTTICVSLCYRHHKWLHKNASEVACRNHRVPNDKIRASSGKLSFSQSWNMQRIPPNNNWRPLWKHTSFRNSSTCCWPRPLNVCSLTNGNIGAIRPKILRAAWL